MIRRFITGGILCLAFSLAFGFPQMFSPLTRNATAAAFAQPSYDTQSLLGSGASLIDPTFGGGGTTWPRRVGSSRLVAT